MDSRNSRTAGRPGIQNNAEVAYRRLREKLVAGDYEAGQRLTELGLCDDLGMSRTPVREALRRLQSDGLVAATGRGVVVNSLSADDIRYALELHGALDMLAARLSAQAQHDGRLAPAQLAELQTAAEQVAVSAERGDPAAVWAANLEFHRCLTRLSGNPLLEEASDRIWDRFAIVSKSNISHRGDLTPRAHSGIVEAIVAGDVVAAERAAAEHVREAAARYATE
ncbi:GntR family transcriptional regulator [Gordonia sp. TBRC 11910]|uniref:GntR family transcriptional regulator n=1 Tax=Gordonia asplenii TaxID=2725283 RepID=A0A848L3C6_9ACTN|nr:GntR family transcriptional regulator [Gordonia asplenii]NMO03555.1 GntR family transcriptional regulator [Gordonia asplenii]